MKIFKYGLAVRDDVRIALPRGARILCVQVQDVRPCLWALVDPEAPTCERLFCWRGTGQEMGVALEGTYVGTVQLARLVFHLFDCGAA